VVLLERDASARESVLERVERLLDDARRRGLQTPLEAADRLRMVRPGTEPVGLVVVTGGGAPVAGAVRLRRLTSTEAEVVCPDATHAAEAGRWFAALGLAVYGTAATAGSSAGAA
jgi:hypothetical protein